MKHLKQILHIVLIISVGFFISACSLDRQNEAPPDQGKSQVNLHVACQGEGPHETNRHFLVTIQEGYLVLNDISIFGLARGQMEASPVTPGFPDRHHEGETEFDSALEIEGPMVIDITRKNNDLGFFTANPGEFTTFSFIIHPEDEDALPLQPAIEVAGSASRDEQDYPFHLSLPLELLFISDDLDIDLDQGHYRRITIFFETDEWFDYVDFSSAVKDDGIIRIDLDNNTNITATVLANILEHYFIEIHND